MKLKVYLSDKTFRFVNVTVANDVKTIAIKFDRWEYVL